MSLLHSGSGFLSGLSPDVQLPDCSAEMPKALSSASAEEESDDLPNGEPREWVPETMLRCDQDGSCRSGVSANKTEGGFGEFPSRAGAEPFEMLAATSPAWESPFWSSPSGVIRAMLEPLDVLCRREGVQAACEKGFSDLSIATSLPDLIESVGCAIGTNSVLSVNFDMLGFEESESSNHVILDPRHGTPRLGYLSTSLGVSFRF